LRRYRSTRRKRQVERNVMNPHLSWHSVKVDEMKGDQDGDGETKIIVGLK
jgi:hypothetical protein